MTQYCSAAPTVGGGLCRADFFVNEEIWPERLPQRVALIIKEAGVASASVSRGRPERHPQHRVNLARL